MKRRRQSIPENRVDLEIEIQDSDRQRNRPNPFTQPYECACGNVFTRSRVPAIIAADLRCPECKEKE